MNKITSINGTLMAPLGELNEHVENGTAHVTEEERAAWNNKADASALASKVSTATFNAHTDNLTVHITAEEREEWNGKQDKLTDESGNMTLAGGLTATSGTINGPLKAGDPAGTPGNGRLNNIYGTTWFHGQAEFRNGGTLRGDLQIESGVVRIGPQASMTVNGAATFAGTVTASGGVRVPAPATAQEAISWEALTEQQALRDWRRMTYYMDSQVPSWATAFVRSQQLSSAYRIATPNTSIQEGILNNDLYDHVITIKPAAGISILGLSTGAWKLANYMGNYRNADYAAASVWRIFGADKASIILGSTSQGYATTTSSAASCYSHPIHWADYQLAGADYRYPLDNAVNNLSDRPMVAAWQVTTYGKSYLGSSTSCLIRGTHYGPNIGESFYIWALTPSFSYIAVAMTPAHHEVDGRNVTNRWLLMIDGKYVMPMTSLYWGAGNTACLTTKVKAHEVRSACQVGLRMGGMRIDNNPALGITATMPVMERVVMKDATVKPVPEVEASALEVPAAGGEVTLQASSSLKEALYVANDTMCGHDPATVWCSQSTEQILAGDGQVVLTLAANATGQPRQVWVFVGHHYAQAAVVKINQLA